MNQHCNQNLYEGALECFLQAGAPQEVAEKAARVVAKDDPSLENFGRTCEDQEAVHRAWCYLVFGTKSKSVLGVKS